MLLMRLGFNWAKGPFEMLEEARIAEEKRIDAENERIKEWENQ